MKKYIVEYLENGIIYAVKTFIDYEMATAFYNSIRKREWARMS